MIISAIKRKLFFWNNYTFVVRVFRRMSRRLTTIISDRTEELGQLKDRSQSATLELNNAYAAKANIDALIPGLNAGKETEVQGE